MSGADILDLGTRNPGAANVFRMVSRSLGVLVLLVDVMLGIASVGLANGLGVPRPLAAVAGDFASSDIGSRSS